nr:MAG TPA: hypothetical protein [Caudoviricetes sp.]
MKQNPTRLSPMQTTLGSSHLVENIDNERIN